MHTIVIQPMDAEKFSPFGELIDFNGEHDFTINNGMCDRFHALAETETIGEDSKTIISLGHARPYALPLTLKLLERHPLGSQAFIPLEKKPFLVIVAPDKDGSPCEPLAFLTEPGQGVNYHRNTWHAVLTPLDEATNFIIIDRDGPGSNLEEHAFDTPYLVTEPG